VKTIIVQNDMNYVIRAGRVFDGQTLLPHEKTDIFISNGTIAEIRPGSGPAPDGDFEPVDLQDCTVLPGLVDCHVHLALDGRDFNAAVSLWSREDLLLDRIGSDLRKILSSGVVAVRDGGDREWAGLRARDEVKRGRLAGPRILSPGIALGRKGGYGSFLGPGIDGGNIETAVRETAARGIDHIKVLVSGVVSFKEYHRVGDVQFSKEELGRLVTAAHSLGLGVMAHASSDEAARLAVEAGVDSLEHGYFISRSTLERMAALGIHWIPTLAPVANQLHGRLRESHTPEELAVIEKTLRRQLAMVETASGLGVPLGAGSDAGATGVPHGEGLLDELLLMEKAGLGGEEILRAATDSNARVLGLAGEMGRVAPGLPPRLIAVRGNPVCDLSCIRNVEFMILPSKNQSKS
jgi:imidazolonepropionase-like amidohydrolase